MRKGLVELKDFLLHQLHRPLVGDDVVDRQEQPVLRVGEVDHGRANQRGARQVERLAPVVPHRPQPRPLPLRRRPRPQIEVPER